MVVTVVIWLGESASEFIAVITWRNLAQTLEHEARMDAYRHIQTLEMAYFEDRTSGGLMTVLNDDINQLERFVNDGASQIIQVVASTILCSVAFIVLARTREIGVRVALGATPLGVVKLVLRGALRQVAWGIAMGLPVCLLVSWTLSGALGGSVAFAPMAYVGVPALLLATALLATVLPARRATRIAPTEALRED